MPSIIVLDDLSPEGLALLDASPGITYEVRTGLKGADLKKALGEFDGAICRSGVKLTADVLEGQTRLKGVVRGRGDRQHRQVGRHPRGDCGDEHAGRQHHQHG